MFEAGMPVLNLREGGLVGVRLWMDELWLTVSGLIALAEGVAPEVKERGLLHVSKISLE